MGKPGVQAVTVSTVAIEIQRGWLTEMLTAANQADRHLSAIGRNGPDASALIGVRIERTLYRRLLEHLLLAVG